MPQVDLGRNPFGKAIKYLDLVSEAAEAWAAVRDNPKTMDWLAFGIRCTNLAYQTRGQWRSRNSRMPCDFLDDHKETWKAISPDVAKAVMKHVIEPAVVPEYWDGDPESYILVEGKVGTEVVRWGQDGRAGAVDYGPYVMIEREEALMLDIGARIWRDLNSEHAMFARGNITLDPLADKSGVMTDESQELYERVQAFHLAGETYACLLLGPPGAGKSTAIRQVAQRLGLKTLKISVKSLSSEDGNSQKHGVPASLDGVRAVIRILRADVLILEDLDRLDGDSDLLDLLEVARLTSKIVLASANSTEHMMGATLRPGRFDDVRNYAGLDVRLTSELSQGNQEVAGRLQKLPLVYAYEYARRYRVLGAEKALIELDELEERAVRCAEEV